MKSSLLGGNIVVNGVEDLRGNMFCGATRNSPVLEGFRKSEPIRHRV
jgi:hypothetical protein